MRKFIKLLRIKISLSFFFPMAFGFALVASLGYEVSWWKIPVGFLAFFCASFFASTLNFYADVAADRDFEGKFKDMDLKEQPFVTGEMRRLDTVLAFAISAVGCAGLSLAISLEFAAFIIGFALVVGLLYSHPFFRLKARPVTDILCNVAGMGFSLFAGLALGGNYRPPVIFLVWGALFIIVMYIPTVVNDVPFDEAAGYRTSGVFFGAQNLLYASIPLAVAMIPLGIIIALSGGTPWLIRAAAAIGTPLTVAGVSVIIYLWRPPRVELNPDIVLVPMDIVILALVVYGIAALATV